MGFIWLRSQPSFFGKNNNAHICTHRWRLIKSRTAHAHTADGVIDQIIAGTSDEIGASHDQMHICTHC